MIIATYALLVYILTALACIILHDTFFYERESYNYNHCMHRGTNERARRFLIEHTTWAIFYLLVFHVVTIA